MIATFIALFIAGLLLAVYAMLHGVEKKKGGTTRLPPPALNLPALSSLLVIGSATGYLVASRTELEPAATIGIALLAALAGWIATTVLMAAWAFRVETNPAQESLEEVQGILSVVTRTIASGNPGEIRFIRDESEVRMKATSIDNEPVHAGTEVVIERIEGDMAIVEKWSSVERRL